MTFKQWLKQNWKLVLNIVTIVALVGLVFAIREQLGDTVKNLGRVHGWLLLLIIPVEFLNYHAQTKLYQHLFGIVGNKLDYKFLLKAAIELNFVNHVFPSGGVTGLSYFSLRLRRGEELTGAKATLVHFMKLALTFLSFEILIVFALVALALMGRVNDLIILVAGSLSTLLLVGTIGFIYLVESKARIKGFFTVLTKGLNKLLELVRPGKHSETINVGGARRIVDDFHANYHEIRRNYKHLKAPFWYALLANATEVLAVYVVFLAFGEFVNIGAVILAYAIANFAGLISVLPGGVGIYEGLMVGVLASIGVPAAISLPVIIMYRVVNTLIQVPPGYYLYQQTLRQGEKAKGGLGTN